MYTVRMQISIISQVSQVNDCVVSFMVYNFFLTTFPQLGVFKENVIIALTSWLIQ